LLLRHGGLEIIVHRLINFCWFWFKWGLIACVVGAALAVPYFYHRMDEEVRARIESRIAEQYPGLRVSVRSAVLVKNEGVAIRGLSVLDPGAEGPGAELASYDECFLACRTELQDLMSGDLQVTRVTIRRPTLRMTRRPDGTWSAAKLLPLPKFGPGSPEVVIENGAIEVFDPTKNPMSTLMLRDVNLTFAAVADSARRGGASQLRKVQGTLGGDYFRQVCFEGEVDPQQPSMAITGTVEGMDVSPELRSVLPGSLGSPLSILGTLRGQTALRFSVRYDASQPSPWWFDVAGRLVRGRLDDPRLPHPLTEIRASIRVNNQGYAIEDFVARSNQATIQMACRGSGFSTSSPLSLEANVRQLELDHQLLDILPEALQEQWHKYRPEGQVDAEIKLGYDGRQWTPELRLRCLNVSFTHHKFPYRLDHGRGMLQVKDGLLQMSLSAYSENQAVRVDAEVRNVFSDPSGWVEAKGEELPIDQKLLIALPERSQAFVRSLDMRGTISFEYRLSRDAPNEPSHQHLTIRLNRCWIRYDKFPYSLANVRGTLEMVDGNWLFRNLEGNNGASRVKGEGTLVATSAGNELLLHFRAAEVPLEEELRDALQPAMRQVWNVLKPRGVIDLVADMRYLEQTNQFDVSVRAEPRMDVSSIEPVQFPYRLEKLQGVLTYQGGRVTLEHCRAEHGAMKVATTGFCSFLPDGGWQLHLGGLTIDRLRVDRELMQAVPTRLRKVLADLNPSGPISLCGTFDMVRGGNPDEPVRSQWDTRLGLQQVGVDCGTRLDNIHGNVSLTGGFDGQNFYSRGEFALDSLSYKDQQFTQILGPFWIDDQQALLGSWVGRRENRIQAGNGQPETPLRPLSAKIFGGNVYADAWVAFGAQPRYGIQASIVDADLTRCAREITGGHENLRGRVQGAVELRGFGRTCHNLSGHGNFHLRDANIYELPAMISMLKILSIRAPDANAFSKSDIDFRVEGEHIYFEKLDFNGDAISLLGKGEMNLQGETRLTFTAVVGRAELGMPVLRNIFTGASQQFMLIHVGGNLQNPDIRKEAFPGVNQALQQLQDRRAGDVRR
jgi:hypothetical protein